MPSSSHIASLLLAIAVLIRFIQQGTINQLLDYLQVDNNDPFPFRDNFAPVLTTGFYECVQPTQGQIPLALQGGMYARVGSNPFQKETHYHWFDGQGMIHAAKFGEVCVNYTNKFSETPRMQKEQQLGWNSHVRIGTMQGIIGIIRILIVAPLYELLGLVVADPLRDGTANTALMYHHGKMNALVENNIPWQLQIEKNGSLTSENHFSFFDKWPFPTSAHVKHDMNSGDLVLYGYQIDKKPYVVTGVANAKGEIISGPLGHDIPNPVMMHDCAISQHYTIIMDLPFVFDPKNMPTKGNPFSFRSDLNSRFGLHPRHSNNSTETRWFEATPCFVFHTANAWEEKTPSGEDVVVLVAFRYASISLDFANAAQQRTTANQLYEWRFNLNTGKTSERAFEGVPAGEFPVVHPMLLGRKSRYTYFPTNGASKDFPKLNGVAKVDLETGKVLHHRVHGDRVFGGEMAFVTKNGGREDEGYLVGFVHDEGRNVSSLLVLNAESFEQETRIELPARVPYGFHGTFITRAELEA